MSLRDTMTPEDYDLAVESLKYMAVGCKDAARESMRQMSTEGVTTFTRFLLDEITRRAKARDVFPEGL